MKRTRGLAVDVDTIREFDARLEHGARSLSGWRLRSLDLSQRGELLRSVDVAGALFLDCTFAPADEESASLGIPTWHYGHEPPNVFGSAVSSSAASPYRHSRLYRKTLIVASPSGSCHVPVPHCAG